MKRTLSVVTLALAALLAVASFAAAEGTPAKSTSSATPATPATPAAASTGAKATHAAAHTAGPMVDLNSATRDDLMKLPGVGEATADKIIAGRPWTSKSQLVAKGVVNRAAYAKLRGMVVAKQAAAK